MKKKSSETSENYSDLVNLTLTLCSWILPDINVVFKIAISLVLIGILVFYRTKPSLGNVNWDLSGFSSVGLVLLPVLLSIVECWVAWLLFSPAVKNLTQFEVIQAGFTYGILIGIPVTLLATRKNTNTTEDIPAGGKGCVIQIWLTPVFAIIYGLDSTLLWVSVVGPILLVLGALMPALSFFGWRDLVLAVISIIAIVLQNSQFSLIGRWFAGKQ